MEIEIRQEIERSKQLSEAFARLLPQLSPRFAAPSEEWLHTVLQCPTTALFAAWRGDEIGGVLTLGWYDTPTGRKAWIEDVVVDAAMRGTGAGEALVRAALAHAESLGVEKVMLTSSPLRKAAHALYRKVGFEAVETTLFARKQTLE